MRWFGPGCKGSPRRAQTPSGAGAGRTRYRAGFASKRWVVMRQNAPDTLGFFRAPRAALLSEWGLQCTGQTWLTQCHRTPTGSRRSHTSLGDPMLPNFPPGASSAPRERQERGQCATVGGDGDKGDIFVGVEWVALAAPGVGPICSGVQLHLFASPLWGEADAVAAGEGSDAAGWVMLEHGTPHPNPLPGGARG